MRDVLVADQDLARGGLIEPGDAAQHGRLAAPRGAEQYEELAVAHVERQVRDRLRAAGIVRLGETAQRDGRHAGAALMPAAAHSDSIWRSSSASSRLAPSSASTWRQRRIPC